MWDKLFANHGKERVYVSSTIEHDGYGCHTAIEWPRSAISALILALSKIHNSKGQK
jgi:hypothetical protein